MLSTNSKFAVTLIFGTIPSGVTSFMPDEADALLSGVRVLFVVEAEISAPALWHSFIGALTLLLWIVLASKAAVVSSDVHSHQRQIAIFVLVKPH